MQGFVEMFEELINNLGSNDDDESPKPDQEQEPAEREPSLLERMACAKLSKMEQEIHILGCVGMALALRQSSLINDHTSLVDDLRKLRSKEAPEALRATKSPQDGMPPEPPVSPPNPDNHGEASESPTGTVNSDSRLERLESALRSAINTLKSTRMAFHFIAVKQSMAELIELANVTEQPEDERIAKLETGLRHTVEALSGTAIAFKAKAIQQLRHDLTVLLENDANSQP